MAKLFLSAEALTKNYRLLESKTKGLLIPVLKADAYGHGARFAAQALLSADAKMLAVATAYEACELLEYIEKSKHSFTNARILVMGPVEGSALPQLLSRRVILSVHSPQYARELSCALARLKASLLLPARFSLSVHLKLETGMHRLGLRTEKGIDIVRSLPHLKIEGGYSHLSNAADKARTELQKEKLLALKSHLPSNALTHLSASEGLLRYGDLSFSAARAGLALYGIAPKGVVSALAPVMRFSARILSILRAKKGDFIGYGSTRTEKARRLAVIDAGYADGIPSKASNGGAVYLHGRRCAFFGDVCMDRATLDIGNLPLKEGEEITLFGACAGDTAAFAARAGVSPYVLLSLRSARTERIYLE